MRQKHKENKQLLGQIQITCLKTIGVYLVPKFVGQQSSLDSSSSLAGNCSLYGYGLSQSDYCICGRFGCSLERPDIAPTPPISTTGGASGFSPTQSTSSLHRPRFCSWEECETRTPFFQTGSKASSHPIRTRALPGSASLVSSEVTSSVFDSLSPPLHFHTDLLLSVLPLLSNVFSVGPFFTFWGYKIRQHFHIK